jgi:protein transport protein SEC20
MPVVDDIRIAMLTSRRLRMALRSVSLSAGDRLKALDQSIARAHLLGSGQPAAVANPRGWLTGMPLVVIVLLTGDHSTEDEALMSATADVTSSLRNTMQLMQQELDRSLLSNQLLGPCCISNAPSKASSDASGRAIDRHPHHGQ